MNQENAITLQKPQDGETPHPGMTIMIFAEGTILKPKSWFCLYAHKSYVPIGNCVELLQEWQRQGANIVYCTSQKGRRAEDIAGLLIKYRFPGSTLFFRSRGKKYKDLVERVHPDVLIEDNCKSIGGGWQMCITKVSPLMKATITSIVVEEFGGLDHLPQNTTELSPLKFT